MVGRVGRFQFPPLDHLALGPFRDLMLRRDLFCIFQVAVFMYHPGSAPVWPPHSGGDHVLVFSAVHQNQLHTVGAAPRLVHGGNSVMSLHSGDALAGPHPFRIDQAELINRVGLVAAVHQGQFHHHFFARRQGKSGIHNPLHLHHRKGLAVGHVLAGHKIAPGSDRPVQTIFLHVDPSGQQFGPLWQFPGGHVGLALHNQVCIGFQLGVLPRLR